MLWFKKILPNEDILTEDLDIYNIDWLRKYKGNSKLVLKPKSTESVSRILQYCYQTCLKVIPQGGNTSLVRGFVSLDDEIIINLSKLNKIIYFDKNFFYFKL